MSPKWGSCEKVILRNYFDFWHKVTVEYRLKIDLTLTQMVVLGKNLVQGFLDQKETQNDGSIFFLNISMKLQQHKDCKFGEAI